MFALKIFVPLFLLGAVVLTVATGAMFFLGESAQNTAQSRISNGQTEQVIPTFAYSDQFISDMACLVSPDCASSTTGQRAQESIVQYTRNGVVNVNGEPVDFLHVTEPPEAITQTPWGALSHGRSLSLDGTYSQEILKANPVTYSGNGWTATFSFVFGTGAPTLTSIDVAEAP